MSVLDGFDFKIMSALQEDGGSTNAALADRVGLSASQCSRRRAALEAAGYIRGYRADLDPEKLGFTIEAFTRVTLAAHSETTADEFAAFLGRCPEVQQAHAISGDADYLVHIRGRSLTDLADFIHGRLLPHKQVSQVRSDIVLRTIKENRGFAVGLR
ncbi:MAG: Lrp/AsnC family transcriptional regulator [Pseudomonadota bacterium]